MSDDPEDYKVGYKKPPKHSRWPKGKSGNPDGGRRKKKGSAVDMLARDVPVEIDGEVVKMPLEKAALRSLLNEAFQDTRAAKAFLKHTPKVKLDHHQRQPEPFKRAILDLDIFDVMLVAIGAIKQGICDPEEGLPADADLTTYHMEPWLLEGALKRTALDRQAKHDLDFIARDTTNEEEARRILQAAGYISLEKAA